MKRTRIEEEQSLTKKQKQDNHDQIFNLASEMIDIILDYSEIRDGFSLISTSKQIYNHHKDHSLFSASKWIQMMEQLSPYHASLFEKASKFITDQHKAKQVEKKEKSKVEYLLELIRKKHGKLISKRELKSKIFKKMKYAKVDHQDMNREVKIGNYLIIHTCDYNVDIHSYESQDFSVWYKCKIKQINGENNEEFGEFMLIDSYTWLCDWRHSNSIDEYLNEIFSIDESIDPGLIAVCLLITGPHPTWACHSLEKPTEITSRGAFPRARDDSEIDSSEKYMIDSLFKRFTS